MKTPTNRSKLLEELGALTRERYLDGLVRQLERQFDGQGLDVDGAVGAAVAIMVKKADTLVVNDVRSYLYVVAANQLRKAARRRSLFPLRDDDEDEDDGVEDEALRTEVFKYVKGIIQRWENASLRATAMVVIDATFLGEPLSTEELAEQLEEILGEEVSLPTVRKWKQRSLDRLAAELHDQGFID